MPEVGGVGGTGGRAVDQGFQVLCHNLNKMCLRFRTVFRNRAHILSSLAGFLKSIGARGRTEGSRTWI